VREALRLGPDMIEVDVALSRDREVVVIHDATLERTTDGTGPVAARTLAEIRRLDAGSWFDARVADERVPRLAEILDLCRGRAPLNVEIKAEAVDERVAGGASELVIRTVHDHRMADAVLLSSFDPRALLQARQVDPDIPRAALLGSRCAGRSPAEILASVGAVVFGSSVRRMTEGMVRECHDHGALVTVYTVNAPARMRRLAALGVDGVFSDFPGRLIAARDATP